MARITVRSTCPKCGEIIDDGDECILIKSAILITMKDGEWPMYESYNMDITSTHGPKAEMLDGSVKKVRFTSSPINVAVHVRCATFLEDVHTRIM